MTEVIKLVPALVLFCSWDIAAKTGLYAISIRDATRGYDGRRESLLSTRGTLEKYGSRCLSSHEIC